VNRRYIVGAIVAAVVVVGVLVGISLAGGGGDDGPTVSADTVQGAAAVKTLMDGIPQDGNVIGDPKAPVTIVEYGDISCPGCRQSSETTTPAIVKRYIRDGTVKMEFRPVAFINTSSERGALGALAAAKQNALWPFITVAYKNQGAESTDWFTEPVMTEVARQLGLDVDKWTADFDGDAVVSEYFGYESQANTDNVHKTPTFIVSGPGGRRELVGAVDLAAFEEAISAVQQG
jgi:protein-disulfide isomerase